MYVKKKRPIQFTPKILNNYKSTWMTVTAFGYIIDVLYGDKRKGMHTSMSYQQITKLRFHFFLFKIR